MTHYNYAQLEGLWINAGGPKAQAPVAAAIAEAESGGNSQAVNPSDNNGTQTSWGLWQISNGTHNQPVPNILSPAVNASQAVAKYKASGWSPWGTWTSGAFRAYLSGSTTPDTSVSSTSSSGDSTATLTSAQKQSESACLWGFGGLSSGSILGFNIGPSVGSFCIFSKSQGRVVLGAMLMLAGGGVAGLGLILLMAAALGRSGAAGRAAQVIELAPGTGSAARILRTAHKRTRGL